MITKLFYEISHYHLRLNEIYLDQMIRDSFCANQNRLPCTTYIKARSPRNGLETHFIDEISGSYVAFAFCTRMSTFV